MYIIKKEKDKFNNDKEFIFILVKDLKEISEFDYEDNKLSEISENDKVYFPKLIEFPRYKYNILSSKINTRKVNKIENADVVVIGKNYIKNIIKRLFKINEYGGSYLYEKKDSENEIIFDYYRYGELREDFYLKGNIFAKFFLNDLNYIKSNFKNIKIITPEDLQCQISKLSGISLDESVINQLDLMFNSSNKEDEKLAVETLCNIDIKESPFFILYYFNLHANVINENCNVNVKSIRKQLESIFNGIVSYYFIDENSYNRDLIEYENFGFICEEQKAMEYIKNNFTKSDKLFILYLLNKHYEKKFPILKDLNIKTLLLED
jgi:hypothetical protein